MNEIFEEKVLAKFFIRNLILQKEKYLGAGKYNNEIQAKLIEKRLILFWIHWKPPKLSNKYFLALSQIDREIVFSSFLKLNDVKNIILYNDVEENSKLIDNHVNLISTINI